MKCTAVVLFIVFLLFFMLMLFEMNLGNSDSIINNCAVRIILGNIILLYFARVNLGKSKVSESNVNFLSFIIPASDSKCNL